MADFREVGREFISLLDILARLRGPEGCPWDCRQGKEDVLRYLLDEAYELADAVNEDSPAAIKEELGDLLYQILFIARIAEEERLFDLKDVLSEIKAKMVRRHPHVFETPRTRSVEEIKFHWVKIKEEKENNHKNDNFFARIPKSQPALLRAQKVTERAAEIGFDWDSPLSICDKIAEELAELNEALRQNNQELLKKEAGDLIFSVMNLCRFSGLNAEEVLQETTDRFVRRFDYMKEKLTETGRTLGEASVTELNRLWEEAKAGEIGS